MTGHGNVRFWSEDSTLNQSPHIAVAQPGRRRVSVCSNHPFITWSCTEIGMDILWNASVFFENRETKCMSEAVDYKVPRVLGYTGLRLLTINAPLFYWLSTCKTNMTLAKQTASVSITILVRAQLRTLPLMIHRWKYPDIKCLLSRWGKWGMKRL